MISEIAFVNRVMALWQRRTQQADCCSTEGLPLYNPLSLDAISSEGNAENTVAHAKWGNWVYSDAWFHSWDLQTNSVSITHEVWVLGIIWKKLQSHTNSEDQNFNLEIVGHECLKKRTRWMGAVNTTTMSKLCFRSTINSLSCATKYLQCFLNCKIALE